MVELPPLLPWMVHAVAVGALLAGGAWLLDRSLGRLGLPRRGAWVAALVATLTLPVWAAVSATPEAPNLERVEVLKGAAATERYGSRAADGVVKVRTADGLEGEPGDGATDDAAELGPPAPEAPEVPSTSQGERLYVVDGVVVGGAQRFQDLDLPPERVERVEVIRGAAARERYGSRASGGIVEVRTSDGGADDGRL